MLRRTLTLVALAALAAPALPRADDREWEEDYTDRWSDERPADYDVSVDMNDSGAVNFDTFQGALSPYGEWVVVGGYGRVWRPHVAAGWRPYYYGRWEWTSEGWLWVSDEPFGWAAYHYGRWTWDPTYGWVWIPGYQWAPAWVAWRYSGDVVGWAPLGPGVSIYVSSYPFVDAWWTFVPCGSFVSYPVYRVAYAPRYTRQYFYATAPAPPMGGGRAVPGRPGGGARPAPGRPAWGGPAPAVIEQRIGRPVTPVRVVAAPAPGPARLRSGEVSIYRPGARPAAGARSDGVRGAPGSAPTRGAPGLAPPSRGESRGAPGYAPPSGGGTRAAPGSNAPSRGAPGYAPPSRGGGPSAAPPSRGPSAAPPARGGRTPDAGPRGEVPRAAPGYARQDRGGDPWSSAGTYGSRGAPARSAPSYSAPPARSAPAYSAPTHAAPVRAAPPAASHGGGRAAPAPHGGGRGGDRR